MPVQINHSARRDDTISLQLPAGALGSLILFWGYASSNLAVAAVLCFLVEGLKFSPYRWQLSTKQFQNVADLSSVLFAVVVVYQFVQYAFYGIYGILSLIPICIFPLIFAQRLSTNKLFPMSALFLSLRRKIAVGKATERWVSTEFIYGLSCILAASVNEFEWPLYAYAALAGTIGLLFFARTRSRTPVKWAIPIIIVIALSVSYQAGIQTLYRSAESSMSYWFNQFVWAHANPDKERTALGQLGRLKLSDRILIRVKAPLSIPLPLYLHEASYNRFHLGSWSARGRQRTALDPLPSADRWQFSTEPGTTSHTLEITTRHREDVAAQVFPLGLMEVHSGEIIEIQTNPMGTVMLEAIPGQLRYQVAYDANVLTVAEQWPAPPGEVDLEIPAAYKKTIDKVVQQLELESLSQRAIVEKVSEHFRANFHYSLVQRNDYPGKKPLVKFLENDRQGHCEYFATATALILRAAGIPTRYSVGYVVDEYSDLEQAFVARARHAHSWVSAYVDNRWQKFDTTPGNWLALEEQRVSSWQQLNDLASWVGLHIKRLQRLERSTFNKRIIWLVPVLALLLMWRLRKQIRPRDDNHPTDPDVVHRADSADLNALVRQLELAGHPLQEGQSLTEILRHYFNKHEQLPPLSRLIYLHYLKRYSNHELSSAEQSELDNGVMIYSAAINDKQ